MSSTAPTLPVSLAANPKLSSWVKFGADGQVTLTDLGSKNGTFVRITDESPLNHGDYVFLGQQLLRVEVT